MMGDVTGSTAANNAIEFSCKEAARLMSQRRDRELAADEATLLKQHLLICRNCLRFDAQLDFLSRAAVRYAKGTT